MIRRKTQESRTVVFFLKCSIRADYNRNYLKLIKTGFHAQNPFDHPQSMEILVSRIGNQPLWTRFLLFIEWARRLSSTKKRSSRKTWWGTIVSFHFSTDNLSRAGNSDKQSSITDISTDILLSRVRFLLLISAFYIQHTKIWFAVQIVFCFQVLNTCIRCLITFNG
jgi:hypothetical protein